MDTRNKFGVSAREGCIRIGAPPAYSMKREEAVNLTAHLVIAAGVTPDELSAVVDAIGRANVVERARLDQITQANEVPRGTPYVFGGAPRGPAPLPASSVTAEQLAAAAAVVDAPAAEVVELAALVDGDPHARN